jgi:hypothetical protein
VQASLGATPGKLTIFWHGPVPAEVANYTQSLGSSNSVVFTQVPYSIEQLNNEARRITQLPNVVSVAPASDFRGLAVRIDTTKVSVSNVQIESPIPLTLTGNKGGFVPLFRDADAAPFSGGAWIISAKTGNSCSTGFEVILNGTGGTGLTTADHCDPGQSTGNQWATAGQPALLVGTVLRGSGGLDSLILTGQSYQPLIYTGNWDSGTGVFVEDFADAVLDSDVCDGGAFTGEVCGIGVVEVNEFVDGVGPGYTTFSSVSGSAGPGDSGGPSYFDENGGAVAQGTISDGLLGTEAPCPASAINIPRTCYKEIFHPDINEMLTALNATMAFP